MFSFIISNTEKYDNEADHYWNAFYMQHQNRLVTYKLISGMTVV